MTRDVVGVAGWGARGAPAHDRRSAAPNGWVARTTGHAYEDGQAKGRIIKLLGAESTSALFPGTLDALHSLHSISKLPDTTDRTQYGKSRGATRSFFRYHATAISYAVVTADAKTIIETARELGHWLMQRGRS